MKTTKLIKGLALAFAATFTLGTVASAQMLTVNTENYPPFNYEAKDGSVRGISTEILFGMLDRADMDIDLRVKAWKDAYGEALAQPNTCVYSTSYTEDRAPKFKWVGPLVNNDWVIFGKPGGAAPKSIADLNGMKVGGYEGDAVATFLKNEGVNVIEARADDQNVQKLREGWVDVWATGRLLGRLHARKQGVELVELFTLKETFMSLACNPTVNDDTISKLQSALDQMKTDGTYEALAKAAGESN